MRRIRLLSIFLWVLIPLLSSCAIDVSQSTPKTAQPGAAGLANAQPTLTTKIPVSWSALKLTGKLVFVSALPRKEFNPRLSVQQLDLVSGDLTTLFQGQDQSWIYSLAISPDGKTLVMSYAGPTAGSAQAVETLYQMPVDGSAPPKILLPNANPSDQYLQPEWSPDGQFLYFSHLNTKSTSTSQPYPTYEILRLAYPNGTPEKVADTAFWPRLARDGTRLVYISSDIHNGKNKIFLADPNGKNAHEVPLNGSIDIIDAPIFSPDGKNIYFSAPSAPAAVAPNWIDRILGVTPVQAHTVPSEWYGVALSGGAAQPLTHLQSAGLFASTAPDGQHIASYSANGIFVMNVDASGVTMIIPDVGGIYGTVSWLP